MAGTWSHASDTAAAGPEADMTSLRLDPRVQTSVEAYNTLNQLLMDYVEHVCYHWCCSSSCCSHAGCFVCPASVDHAVTMRFVSLCETGASSAASHSLSADDPAASCLHSIHIVPVLIVPNFKFRENRLRGF